MTRTKRRTFLAVGGLALPGLGCFSNRLLADDFPAPEKQIPRDVADFWIRRVGLAGVTPPSAQAPAGSTRTGSRRRAAQSMQEAYGQEPLFLYVDPEENSLVPANEIAPSKLLPAGDTSVELKVTRVRLNADDRERLAKFESAAIYLDVQQQAGQDVANSVACAMLGALFPNKPNPAAARIAAPRPQPGPAQTIALPDGAGASTFCCFLKDGKRSPFGKMANALLELSGAAAADFMPLLGMPGLMPPALNIVRTLVFNLQARGEQEWLFQDTAIALASTAEKATNSAALRLRSGNYIIIPKSHSTAIKANQSGVKVVDGFLVPKAAGVLDVYDAAPETAKNVSYLSLAVSVKRAKLNRCNVLA